MYLAIFFQKNKREGIMVTFYPLTVPPLFLLPSFGSPPLPRGQRQPPCPMSPCDNNRTPPPTSAPPRRCCASASTAWLWELVPNLCENNSYFGLRCMRQWECVWTMLVWDMRQSNSDSVRDAYLDWSLVEWFWLWFVKFELYFLLILHCDC